MKSKLQVVSAGKVGRSLAFSLVRVLAVKTVDASVEQVDGTAVDNEECLAVHL